MLGVIAPSSPELTAALRTGALRATAAPGSARVKLVMVTTSAEPAVLAGPMRIAGMEKGTPSRESAVPSALSLAPVSNGRGVALSIELFANRLPGKESNMTNLKDILRDMALEVQKNEHSFDEPDGEPGRNIEEIVDEYLEAVVIRLIGYEV